MYKKHKFYKLIFILISILFFSINLFASSVSEIQKFGSSSSYDSIFGGNGSNSAELNLDGNATTKLGMKTDCTQLQFNYDVGAYLQDIINQVKQYAKQSKQIILVNSILTAIAYPVALQRCVQETGMDLSQAPILADLQSRVKELVIGKSSDAISVDTKAAGGNPSYAGGGVTVKTKELANIGAEVNATIQSHTGKLFRDCMTREISSIVDFINKILNWKLTFNYKYLAKLKAECKLKNEQLNIDLGQALKNMYDQYSEIGEMCFFDGICIDKNLKVHKKGQGADMPTNEEKRNIISEVGTDWLNTYIASSHDPLVALIISEILTKFENNVGLSVLDELAYVINVKTDNLFMCMKKKTTDGTINLTTTKDDALNEFFECVQDTFNITDINYQNVVYVKAYIKSNLEGTDLKELLDKYTNDPEMSEYIKNELFESYVLSFVTNINLSSPTQIDFFHDLVENLFYLYDNYYFLETYFRSEKMAQITKSMARSSLVLLERTNFAIEKRKITAKLMDNYYITLVQDKREEYKIPDIINDTKQ
ncbi:hypothetical protein DEFDS_P240 (plasmid) [Deferribacter desulfuricans SSM1]|uniref:Uncharacterized protein n=1 Tax=Deferribacter desulfuricans (strain DSM 14783 / JCM 11476 / NBRC 101012 / SSM1) TaxID=639282 RepID=D3PF68_DEFDS|nr:hypothetical protein [Deferribacter desulfuricans]BAI81860.1 hypothetical protein DEFDS_P240 [Deferribacter desulfuricans SSM1]